MGLPIIWSNFDDESDGENANNVITYYGKYEAESESTDEYMTNEKLAADYRFFLTKWEEACIRKI